MLLFIINRALLINWRYLYANELPMLGLAKMLRKTQSIIYSVVLIMAIVTTAASAGLCFVDGMRNLMKINHKTIIAVLGVVCLILSQQGFSRIVANIYPLFGYMGIPIFLLVISRWIRVLTE